MEDSFINIARTLQRPVVVLCDRGALDVAAFMLPHDWSATLSAAGVMVGGDLLRRYQLVVHMVTAAEGAEHAYTRDNNAARREDMKGQSRLSHFTGGVWLSCNAVKNGLRTHAYARKKWHVYAHTR